MPSHVYNGSSHSIGNAPVGAAAPPDSFVELRLGEERSVSADQASLLTGSESEKGSFGWFKGSSSSSSARKCSLPTVHKHGWKPETMKAPVLISFASASVLLAVLLELLAQQSQKEGGLSLVNDGNDLPSLATFGYLYLPTIVAVVYSLIWNWVDLDVKRAQPWLELSKPAGATGLFSLFLDYPFDFVAFVPFKAARRRHWTVFHAGTVMVMIFWILTPLQSAVFGSGSVLVQRSASIKYPSTLTATAAQAAKLDQAIPNTGYAITWLNQQYPSFTTSEYALAPFTPDEIASESGVANWTGTTTKYWTDLECWPANVEMQKGNGVGMANIDNGRGCSVPDFFVNPGVPSKSSYKMGYIGYQNSPWAQYFLASPTCGKDASHQFMATWSRYINETNSIDSAAAFCETQYFKQKVSATVSAIDKAPIDGGLRPVSQPDSLTSSEFNTSAFEYLLGSGVSPVDMPRDYPFDHLVEQYPRVEDQGLWYPLDPMIGFAMGAQNYTVDQYANTTILGEAFRAAHKSLFSVAVQHLLVNSTDSDQTDGQLNLVRYGIIVSRVFSAIVEGLLCAIAVLTLLLLWTSQQSPSMLAADPGSLGSLIQVVQNSDHLLREFSGKGNFTEEQLMESLGHYRFHLLCGCQQEDGAMTITITDDSANEKSEKAGSSQAGSVLGQTGHYSPIKPLALKRQIGAVFLLCLGAAVGILAYLKQKEMQLGGLILPSSSFEVNLLLTSFIPTAYSTLVEPFWVLLNRYLCILQPFQDLRANRGSEDRSLKARYTAVPPQLSIWRAAKSGHHLLVAVSAIALLANVLAVGLGGLFNESPVNKTYPLQLLPTQQARFSDEGISQYYATLFDGVPSFYEDPFYVAMANISYGTRMPPWMSKDFFFFPLNFSSDARPNAYSHEATTIGFGVDPSCNPITAVTSEDKPPAIDGALGQLGGPSAGCPSHYQPPSLFLNASNEDLEGPSACEVVDTLSPGMNNFTVTDCDRSLLLGWSRAYIKNQTGVLNSSFVACHPTLRVAKFSVTFDRGGYVQRATRVSNFEDSLGYPNASRQYDTIANHMNHRLRDEQISWHNDTVSSDWFNYLLKIHPDNKGILDPEAPLPDPAAMVTSVAEIYKMLFVLFVGLNSDIFESSGSSPEITTGTQSVVETRILVSTPAFIVSMVILVLYILTAIGFYNWGVKFFLPRMPTTVGSLIAFFASSRVVRQYSSTSLGRERAFGFGRYMGDDGRAHIGIDFAERVVPVKVSSLERGDTRPLKSKLGSFWHRTSPRQGDTWL